MFDKLLTNTKQDSFTQASRHYFGFRMFDFGFTILIVRKFQKTENKRLQLRKIALKLMAAFLIADGF
jgi:hypothetical protein